VHRRAFCVDVPWNWQRSADALWKVRLQLARGDVLVRLGRDVVARIDRKTFRVTR
jgi:hypothetical protein